MLEKAALLLSQARGAYQREHYDIALAYFRRACQVDPHSPEALLGIGEVAAHVGEVREAIAAFLTLADIYTQAGMLEVAAEVIDRVLELDPAQPLAVRFRQFIYGRMRRTTNDTGEAAATGDADSVVTALERQAPVQHSLSEQPSESSLAQLVPWDDESVVGHQTTAVSRELDSLLGDLDIPKTSDRQVAYADTLVTNAEPSPQSEVPIAASQIDSVVIDDDDFADVATRAAPDGLMEDLAKAARGDADPFAAETVVGDVSVLLEQSRPVTEVDAPVDTARGSGRHDVGGLDDAGLDDVGGLDDPGSWENTGGWDIDTTAAVNAENIRVKPRLSLDDVEWDESDFPRFDEAKVTELITRTIALDGEGAVAAIGSLMGVSPLLAQLDISDCQELIENSEVTQCFAGQIVVKEGDAGTSLFLLGTGQAAVEREVKGHAARRVASISAGNFFGEGSLLADAPRSSTVRVIEDALILEVDRALIQRLVSRKPRVLTVLTRFLRARLLSSLMMDSPLFHRLPLAERTALAPKVHLHKLNPGQVVASRGQVLTGFCTVMAGELRRFDIAEGTGRQTVGNLRPGSAFGSRSLFNEPSPVSISASTGCWLLRLPTTDLRELVARHPELAPALREAESA